MINEIKNLIETKVKEASIVMNLIDAVKLVNETDRDFKILKANSSVARHLTLYGLVTSLASQYNVTEKVIKNILKDYDTNSIIKTDRAFLRFLDITMVKELGGNGESYEIESNTVTLSIIKKYETVICLAKVTDLNNQLKIAKQDGNKKLISYLKDEKVVVKYESGIEDFNYNNYENIILKRYNKDKILTSIVSKIIEKRIINANKSIESINDWMLLDIKKDETRIDFNNKELLRLNKLLTKYKKYKK